MARRPQVADRQSPRRAIAWRSARSLLGTFDCRTSKQGLSPQGCQLCRHQLMSRLSRGYTLLELLLVLVVLVMVMALAWPAMTRRLSHHELREASMQLAEAIAETRMNAMDSGEPWVFRYWPETGQYESGPLFRDRADTSVATPSESSNASTIAERVPSALPDTDSTTNQSSDGSALGATRNRPRSMTQAGALPAGFVLQTRHPGALDDLSFENDTISFDEQATTSGLRVDDDVESNALEAVSELEQVDLTGITPRWVIFDPLGKTEDFEVIVATLDQRSSLAVQVRGVTGTVSLGAPQHVIEAADFPQEGVDDFANGIDAASSVGQTGFSAGRSDTGSFTP